MSSSVTKHERLECNACDWKGPRSEAVHFKHDASVLLCPECKETTVQSAPLSSNERTGFEAWADNNGYGLRRKSAPFTNSADTNGDYTNASTQDAWEAWQARASLRDETKAPLPRIRLKDDIYDDGADHHPPGIIAHKGDVLEVRELLSVGAAHPGASPGKAFIVRPGEFEEIRPEEPTPRQPPKPIATVINNNQPGWTNIIETAPNVTLPVGTKLYDESALLSVGCRVADEIWQQQSSSGAPPPPPVCTCTPPKFESNEQHGTFTSGRIDPNCPLHWRQTLIQNGSPENGPGEQT